MQPYVLSAVDRRFERFVAIRAHKRSLVAMRHLMPLHTAQSREITVANGALIRPQQIVRPVVSFQCALSRETPAKVQKYIQLYS